MRPANEGDGMNSFIAARTLEDYPRALIAGRCSG